ncbi:uncharacterized protein cubi_02131 [Cryptosporidium ubiquitum]|uniref:Uncharacterized protein n=1 Tax=Cryptosporidium ubiquitum TaxID=857276 RepID=A0A1J4M9M1_9CRYT|nr:uncharacterized protein cubi_02131 [Cryptosporidium ubiquitum]OII70920.1 hypothetical protein cubi_02131 [Cryptosporidium ubiquitum]
MHNFLKTFLLLTALCSVCSPLSDFFLNRVSNVFNEAALPYYSLIKLRAGSRDSSPSRHEGNSNGGSSGGGCGSSPLSSSFSSLSSTLSSSFPGGRVGSSLQLAAAISSALSNSRSSSHGGPRTSGSSHGPGSNPSYGPGSNPSHRPGSNPSHRPTSHPGSSEGSRRSGPAQATPKHVICSSNPSYTTERPAGHLTAPCPRCPGKNHYLRPGSGRRSRCPYCD